MGVRLAGRILRSHADLKLLSRELSGDLSVEYRNLKVTFTRTIAAPVKNLIADAQMEKMQPHDERPLPVIPVKGRWDGKRGIVGFTLESMGAAAQKIMKK